MKTKVIEGKVEDTKSSKDKYAEKKAKKAAMLKESATVQEVVKQEETKQQEVDSEVVTPSVEDHKFKRTEETNQKVRGKKYNEAKSKIKKGVSYKINEAIKLVKELSYSKFDETMELHLTLKKQGISTQLTLPHSFGKQKKVEVANEKTLESLKNGKVDFDVLLATPEMMPKLAVFARLLGPRGLMPNPKNGTVIKTEKDADKFNANTLNLKTEKEQPLMHTSFGKVSMKDEQLVENASKIIDSLGGTKQITKAFLKSTMSPSIKLSI